MGTKWEKLKIEHNRLLRIMLIGSVVGCIVAYTFLIAAKVIWGIPDHDWWRVAFGPMAFYGYIITGVWLASRSDLRNVRRRDELE